MKRWLIVVLLLLCGRAAPAAAAEQLVFDVPPEGGIYDIPVYPGLLTVLYFPAPVTGFVHGESSGLRIAQRQHILTVELDSVAAPTSMSVECERFRIGVLLRPVPAPEQAAVQVQFRDQSEQQRVAAEVAAQIAARRAEIEQQRADLVRARKTYRRDLARYSARRVRLGAAAAMREHHRSAEVRALARKGVYLIMRVREIVWLGDDAYLRLSIQNRGSSIYRIDRFEARVAGRSRSVELSFPNAGIDGVAGVVPAHATERGVLVIPGARPLMGQHVEIQVIDSGGGVIRMTLPLVQ
jgi:hypothetical protein